MCVCVVRTPPPHLLRAAHLLQTVMMTKRRRRKRRKTRKRKIRKRTKRRTKRYFWKGKNSGIVRQNGSMNGLQIIYVMHAQCSEYKILNVDVDASHVTWHSANSFLPSPPVTNKTMIKCPCKGYLRQSCTRLWHFFDRDHISSKFHALHCCHLDPIMSRPSHFYALPMAITMSVHPLLSGLLVFWQWWGSKEGQG